MKMLFGSKNRNSGLFLGRNANSVMEIGEDTRRRPVAMDADTLKRHVLVLGTSGAGKTEALLGMMANAFAWRSGGLFIDGKGDVSLYAKMAGLAEVFGREDDLYVLNFMSFGENAKRKDFTSHRFNPFERSGPDGLVSLLVSLLDDDGKSSAMWKGRATAMLTGVMRVLCHNRDVLGHRIDASAIRRNLDIKRLTQIAYGEGNLPQPLRSTVAAYLASIPGFDSAKCAEQSQEVLDYHGYMEFQLQKALGIMTDVYGHIFCAGGTDIDFEDILHNRRFVVVLLPALEKANDEIALLGKIVLAAFKEALGKGISGELSGSWEDVVSARRCSSLPPFLGVFDEVSLYAVDGMDLMAAQARSLNVGLIYGSQDMDRLFAGSDRVGRTLLACADTKIIMRSSNTHPELDRLLDEAEPARDDVETFVKANSPARGRRKVFVSARSFLQNMDEGRFILLNSSKLVVGLCNYVNTKPSRLSPVRMHGHKQLASKLVDLERNRPFVGGTGGPPPLPSKLAEMCRSGDATHSPLAALMTCLEMIPGAGPPESTGPTETIVIGA